MKNILDQFLVIIITLTLSSLVLGILTQWLWNTCLVPAYVMINHITFLQSVGLNLLFSIMFKSYTIQK